ncbi:Hypothetical predicted protein [Paramuricea clavata]|uniref:Uncharacterized protein n=1 Tax=Paramuricea clavata TaxID=317549 RepID=A0A6S7LES9_PARCT|nr:Hypothetical predicted protein [Paramuricea clavata]
MNENLRIRYHNKLKVYKNILKLKKEKFQFEKLVDLENAAQNDPNSFWKILKNIEDETPNSSGSNVISEEQWLSYFQTLHSRHELNELQNNITTSLSVEEQNRHHFTNLDYLITDMEIKNAAKKLKKNQTFSLEINSSKKLKNTPTLDSNFHLTDHLLKQLKH